MRFDQAGHDGCTRTIDDLDVGARERLGAVVDDVYAVSRDQDFTRKGWPARTIEDACVGKQIS